MANSSEIPLVLLNHAPIAQLPVELIHSLNQAYFLHVLATDPMKVLPPGKSLLAMMTHARLGDSSELDSTPANQLEKRVKEVVHEAFWTEAMESLSSPLPSVQLPRLKLLYNDLSEALNHLLPPQHRVIQTLNAPVPPTSSPLSSAIHFLKELLHALRQRCAPSRDSTIDQLRQTLDDIPSTSVSSGTVHVNSNAVQVHPLARLVVSTIKSILKLAEDMQSDFNTFVLGTLSENQLMGVLVQEAKLRERQLVLQLWEAKEQSGQVVVREAWRTWVAELQYSNNSSFDTPTHIRWVLRLMQALRSDKAVSCEPPEWAAVVVPSQPLPQLSNKLPPQLFFSSPALLYIQNHLQAIVIAATLRSLARISPASITSPSSDFMQRIWTLLKAEVDAPERGDYIGETKLVHLADEVVRAGRMYPASGSFNAKDEQQLRAAVERTLSSTGPVFLLLQSRLVTALQKYLVSSFSDNDAASQPHSVVPEKMQSGRSHPERRPEKRTRLLIDEEMGLDHDGKVNASPIPAIKGFEDPVLVSAIEDMFRKISLSVAWVEQVWGDLV